MSENEIQTTEVMENSNPQIEKEDNAKYPCQIPVLVSQEARHFIATESDKEYMSMAAYIRRMIRKEMENVQKSRLE